ncbi:hypothetical protein [uncultured Prochlorococcus sp.]|uniref:hypothetical protein n=1 Tax=uncultured Prochlorococcus sp. TaxID=159733 RepID=UPI00258EF5EF|nr:hypothetical protein [uncultured Prochlorococcus sp.]
MPKKVSQKKIEEIINGFFNGKTIDELSKEFDCTKITINRHLKKSIDKEQYKQTLLQNNKRKAIEVKKDSDSQLQKFNEISHNKSDLINSLSDSTFVEIAPLNFEIDNAPQKDLSSIPISKVDFPKIVYMVVDKKIELEIKFLKEYPDWQFLSQEELNRKTIEIFFELKVAKRFCNTNQKVIKVPNTDVFRIAAPFLLKKGISRIVGDDKLISL